MYKVTLDGYILYQPGSASAMLTQPSLELETGYAGIFQATVPPDNPLYDKIFCRKSMVSVFRDDTEIFYGEVRKIPQIDRNRNKEIYCTGALSFLADSIQPQAEYHDISPYQLLKTMLDIHNSQVEERKQIHIGFVTVTDPNNALYRYTNYETTLAAIREKLVGRLGGYLRLRHVQEKLYLDWIQIEEYGNYSTQPIEFGLNLLDYSETLSAEDVVTALIPLGAALEDSAGEVLEKRVDITSVNDGKNYVYSKDAVEQFGWVWATNTWDDVTLPGNLLTKGRSWLETTQFETMTLKLTAADLSELGHDYNAFGEGDRIHCLAKPYGMDIVLPIMKLTIPLQDPAGRTLELSTERQKTYTETQSYNRQEQAAREQEIRNQQNKNIQAGIDNLTNMMSGVGGGYKLTEYDVDGRWVRDLYMDAPNKEQAVRILQINKEGIACSKSGYAGPYTVGITIGGQILGDWLAVNSIDTDKLSIGLNAWIKGTEDGLATKVEKNGIISAINQSSEEVSIDAERINLNGAISANNNVEITTDGKLKAVDGEFSGIILSGEGQIGGFKLNTDAMKYGSPQVPNNSNSDMNVYLGVRGISVDSKAANSDYYRRRVSLEDGKLCVYQDNVLVGYFASNETVSEGQNNYRYFCWQVINGYTGKEYEFLQTSGSNTWMECGEFIMNTNSHLAIHGDLLVFGTKSRATDTVDYGKRLFYCYETPSPLFGDVGEGTIGEDGRCFIPIDPVLLEALSKAQYQVFLQAYGEGTCHVSERESGYFVVSGTPGLSFAWELKAHQAGYDNYRLEPLEENTGIESINYGAKAANHIEAVQKGRFV